MEEQLSFQFDQWAIGPWTTLGHYWIRSFIHKKRVGTCAPGFESGIVAILISSCFSIQLYTGGGNGGCRYITNPYSSVEEAKKIADKAISEVTLWTGYVNK